MRKSWQVFHDRSLLLRPFWSLVLWVLEHGLAVWCSAADSHLKQLDRVVRSAVFLDGGLLAGGVFLSVAVLCMIFKIKSNQMRPLPLPYVQARVTRGALVAHIGTRLRVLSLELLSTADPLFPSQCLFGTILVIMFDGVRLAGFKSSPIAFLVT